MVKPVLTGDGSVVRVPRPREFNHLKSRRIISSEALRQPWVSGINRYPSAKEKDICITGQKAVTGDGSGCTLTQRMPNGRLKQPFNSLLCQKPTRVRHYSEQILSLPGKLMNVTLRIGAQLVHDKSEQVHLR